MRVADLEARCLALGFEYLSLGPLGERTLRHVPAMLAATRSTFATAHVVNRAAGRIDGQAVEACARAMQRCAEIEGGFGNLRFAALAGVGPGTPFSPAAYHGGGPPTYALATEAADLAVSACQGARDAQEAHDRLVRAIEQEAQRLVAVAARLQVGACSPSQR